MSVADPSAARLENLRRSVAITPDRSAVTLHREDVLDLLALVLKQEADNRKPAG